MDPTLQDLYAQRLSLSMALFLTGNDGSAILGDFGIAELAAVLAEEQADRTNLIRGGKPSGGFHKRHLVSPLTLPAGFLRLTCTTLLVTFRSQAFQSAGGTITHVDLLQIDMIECETYSRHLQACYHFVLHLMMPCIRMESHVKQVCLTEFTVRLDIDVELLARWCAACLGGDARVHGP